MYYNSHTHFSYHHTLTQWQSRYLRPSWSHSFICYTPQMWMSRRLPPLPSATLPCMDQVRMWNDWVTDHFKLVCKYTYEHVCVCTCVHASNMELICARSPRSDIWVVQIYIWNVQIPFEWLEFAFEWYEFAFECFESRLNGSNLHSSDSHLHWNCSNPIRMAQICTRVVRISFQMIRTSSNGWNSH